MRFSKPIAITTNAILANNVPMDAGIFEWNAATNYLTGVVVWYGDPYHKRWEALTDNINKAPWDHPDDWLELGPTNPRAMFDPRIGNASAGDSSYSADYAVEVMAERTGIAVRLAPKGDFDALALFDVTGTHVDIIVDDVDGAEVYSRRLLLDQDEDNPSSDVAVWDIPKQIYDRVNDTGAVVWLSIYRPAADGDARCGAVAIGAQQVLGISQEGTASVGITDYSQKSTDDFGNVSIVERRYAKLMDLEVVVMRGDVDRVFRQVASVRARYCVWEASESDQPLLLYGFPRDWRVFYAGPRHSVLSIEVEGLI